MLLKQKGNYHKMLRKERQNSSLSAGFQTVHWIYNYKIPLING